MKDGEGNAVSGAAVEVNGTRLKTSAEGTAVFRLPTGNYNVVAKSRGYSTVQQSVTVADAAVTQDVILIKNG